MVADIAKRKLETISRLALLDDDALFLLIEQLLKDEEGDWGENLTAQQKSDLEEGLQDLEAGSRESYDSFNSRMKMKYQ